MTTLRREFTDPKAGFLLVTVNVETGEVRAATREHAWDQWSRPLPEWDRSDDVEPGRQRGYDIDGIHVAGPAAEWPDPQPERISPES